jgi:restriction system protein
VPIPTYDQFIEPLLRFLVARTNGATAKEAHLAVASALGLSEADLQVRLPSGAQLVYQNRNGWAHDRLKRAGLSSSPSRGTWKLTEAGVKFARRTMGGLTDAQIDQLASVSPTSSATPEAADCALIPAEGNVPRTPALASPADRIDQALSELKESVSRDLLEMIGRAPPDFFETLVLDLLHAMGYGTSRADLLRVGGSGDGGIDGVISLDKLGLEKVYVQAKRWKGAVGSPEVQGFMGALQLQGARKGVLLTTSGFTSEAKRAAGMSNGSVVLVDGQRLSDLMIEHGVGVTPKPVMVPQIDSDYFDLD